MLQDAKTDLHGMYRRLPLTLVGDVACKLIKRTATLNLVFFGTELGQKAFRSNGRHSKFNNGLESERNTVV
jgi:hypothetical protein